MPAVDIWVNASGGDWARGSNWSQVAPPTAGQDAVVSPTGQSAVVTHSSGSDTVANLTSNGALRVSGGTLTVTGSVSGTVGVTSGGALDLTGAVTAGGDFTLDVSGGGVVNLSGNLNLAGHKLTVMGSGALDLIGTLTGGTLDLTGGARLVSQNGTLDGATVDGNVNVAGYKTLTVDEGLVLNGTMAVGDATTTGSVIFNGTETLGGTGTVTFGAYDGGNLLSLSQSNTLTIGSGIVVHGENGLIELPSGDYRSTAVVNQGVIESDAGGTIVLYAGSWTNSGAFAATGGGTLRLYGAGTWDTAAPVDLSGGAADLYGSLDLAGGSLTADGGGTLDLVGSLTGGTLDLTGGATLVALGGTLGDMTVDGGVSVVGNKSLTVYGGLVLNGTMAVGDASTYGIVYCSGTETLGGTGTVTFGAYDGGNVLDLSQNNTLTIGAGIVVHGGSGTIELLSGDYRSTAVVNQGVIESDAGGTIVLYAGSWTNSGAFAATGGGTLRLYGAGTWDTASPVELAGGGAVALVGSLDLAGKTVSVDGDGSLDLIGVLTGGTLDLTGGATLVSQNGSLVGATVDGNVSVVGSKSLFVSGGLVLNGAMAVGDASTYGYIYFSGTETLGGTGTVTFGALEGGNLLYLVRSSSTLTIGASIVVHGGNGGIEYYSSTPDTSVVNLGAIEADAGGTIVLYAGSWTNSGAFAATGGGTLRLYGAGTWDTASPVELADGGTVALVGSLANAGQTLLASGDGSLDLIGTLTGGTLDLTGGARLVAQNGTLDGATVNGDVSVVGGKSLAVQDGLVLNGAMAVGDASTYGSVYFVGGETLDGDGTVTFGALDGGNLLYLSQSNTLTIGAGIVVHGENGIIEPSSGNANHTAVINRGAIEADAGGTIVLYAGSWTNSGTLQALNGGSLKIFGAATEDGSIRVDNHSSLAIPGSVEVDDGQSLEQQAFGSLSISGSLSSNITDPAEFLPAGTVTLNGGSGTQPQFLEAMSQDFGDVSAGFSQNFAFDSLSVAGYTRLIDHYANVSAPGQEAVYVDTLTIKSGATLDLNGLHVYARVLNDAGTVTGGAVQVLGTGGLIQLGVPVSASHPTAGAVDVWTFAGRANQSVSVVVGTGIASASVPQQPYLKYAQVSVIDPEGRVVATASNAQSGQDLALSGLTLPEDGTYQILVQAAPASPNSTGNYVLSAWNAPVPTTPAKLNQVVNGSVDSPFEVDRYTFSSAADQQIAFTLLGSTSSAIQFTLTGPGGSQIFTGIAASSGLLTLPNAGVYTLTAAATGSQTGAFSFRLDQTTQTDLTLGVPYQGALAGSGQAQLYRVNVPTTTQLQVVLRDTNGADQNEVYVKYGSPPTRSDYQYRFSNLASANQQVLAPAAVPGTWYILVYANQVTTPGAFTLTATAAGVVLTGTTPSKAGSNGIATMTLTGAGFDNRTHVDLVAPDGTTHPAPTLIVDSSMVMTATLDTSALAGGTYTVRVTKADGATSELPAAFTVVPGGRAVLTTSVSAPSAIGVRPSSLGYIQYPVNATVYVQYSNTGDVAMPAPLLVLSATVNGQPGALMTLDPSLVTPGLQTSAHPAGFSPSVQFLGSGATPGILQPGESVRVPVYFIGWLGSNSQLLTQPIVFSLGVLDGTNTSAVPWSSLQSTLKPDGISTAAWNALYPDLVAQTGTTWGDYVRRLDENAQYLARVGSPVTDVGQLFSFEVQQANGISPVSQLAGATDAQVTTPGLPLAFGRSFGPTVIDRNQFGAFGWGWSDSWQTSLVTRADGTVVVTGPGGSQRQFVPDSLGTPVVFVDVVERVGSQPSYPSYPALLPLFQNQPNIWGTYDDQPGDHGTLKRLAGGGYTLTEQDGQITAYNADGTLEYVQDTNGNRITAGYTGGLMTRLADSSGQALVLNYNSAGLISRITDSAGRATTYAYDASNQDLLTVTDFAGHTTHYAYNVAGSATTNHELLSVTNADGTHEYFSYDSAGRLIDTHLDGGAEDTTFGYADGQVSVTDALGDTTEDAFDYRGLLVRVTNSLGQTNGYSYDTNLDLVQTTDAAGQVSAKQYDLEGNLTSSTDALGDTVYFTYTTADDRLASVTDANGHTTQYGYDGKGNLVKTKYADGTLESLARDPRGNVITSTSRAGQATHSTYDAAGNVLTQTYADGSQATYSYDGHENLTHATDGTGTTTLLYDAADQLTRITYPSGRYLQFTYDSASRRTRMVDQDGFTVNYAYDALGRLSALTDGFGSMIARYTYDAVGRLSRQGDGNGTYTTYAYDAAGNLLHLVNYAPNGSINSRFDYTYDSLGNRIGEATLDGAWAYTYDATGQLTHAVFTSSNSAIASQDLAYAYDASGSRTQTIINGVTTAYSTNNLNEYTQVGGTQDTYDANGNLVTQTDAGGTTTYAYNVKSQLVGVSGPGGTWTNHYDVFGDLAGTTANGQTTQYLIDPSGLGNVVAAYSSSGATLSHYVFGLGLVSQFSASNTAYYNFDAIGSTVGISTTAGFYVNKYSYLPFGEFASAVEGVANPFQFGGQAGLTNEGSGLVAMRARNYSITLGRFTSSDPLGLLGGVKNQLDYANNNPTRYTDPSGAITIGQVLVGTAIIGAAIYLAPGALIFAASIDLGLGGAEALGAASLAYPEIAAFILEDATAGYEATAAAITFAWNQFDPGPDSPPTNFPELAFFVLDKYLQQLEDGLGSGAGSNPDSPGPNSPGGPSNPPTPPSSPLSNAPTQLFVPVVSHDPNDIEGPAGYGSANFVSDTNALLYRIEFENDPKATGPAQRVVVTDQLDPDLDWNTFRFTEVGFGDTLIVIPPDTQDFETRVATTENGETFVVNVEVGLNAATGQVFAIFQSLDPDTQLPPDVFTGFLPPEDGTGRGTGFVGYTITPKSGLPTATQIRTVADITFDGNPSIATDQVSETDPAQGTDPAKQARVTIDGVAPSSSVQALPAISASPTFTVRWGGSDDGGGSGVASYDIFVSVDGSPAAAWLTSTTRTSADFVGAGGHSYAFYSVAVDNVGQRQATPTTYQARTTVFDPALPSGPDSSTPTSAGGTAANGVTTLSQTGDTTAGIFTTATASFVFGSSLTTAEPTTDAAGPVTTVAETTQTIFILADFTFPPPRLHPGLPFAEDGGARRPKEEPDEDDDCLAWNLGIPHSGPGGPETPPSSSLASARGVEEIVFLPDAGEPVSGRAVSDTCFKEPEWLDGLADRLTSAVPSFEELNIWSDAMAPAALSLVAGSLFDSRRSSPVTARPLRAKTRSTTAGSSGWWPGWSASDR